jgi:hypothetical protein
VIKCSNYCLIIFCAIQKKKRKEKGLLLFYTWSLKPQGCKNCKSIGDSKNQKKDREAAREGLHPRKQRVNKEKLAT